MYKRQVFFKPTAIYTATGGAPGLAIIAWVVTSLVCLCAAMTFAEIAILIPETGGMPVYLKKVFGDRVGYLCGWMQTVVFYPGLVAALAVAVANQAKLFLGDGMVVPVAIVCICLLYTSARDIAKVLQAKQKGEGCLIGERYVVSWAVGHLVTLAEPEEYLSLIHISLQGLLFRSFHFS